MLSFRNSYRKTSNIIGSKSSSADKIKIILLHYFVYIQSYISLHLAHSSDYKLILNLKHYSLHHHMNNAINITLQQIYQRLKQKREPVPVHVYIAC